MSKYDITPENFETEVVDISQIRGGDTIINQIGALETVSAKYIGYSSFYGITLDGSSYRGGRMKIIRFLTNKNGCLIPKK